MDNNFNQQKPSGINVMELIALICSGVGTVMAIVGAALTCSCSASKTWDSKTYMANMVKFELHKTSLVWLVAFFGALIAITGVVLAIVALKQKNVAVKAGKLSYIAIAVGSFGFLYGILPILTICGYNCSLNSSYEDTMKNSFSSIGNLKK